MEESRLIERIEKLTTFAFRNKVCFLSVMIVDDQTIAEINRVRRGKNKPTDVLSFPLYFDQEPWILPPVPGIEKGNRRKRSSNPKLGERAVAKWGLYETGFSPERSGKDARPELNESFSRTNKSEDNASSPEGTRKEHENLNWREEVSKQSISASEQTFSLGEIVISWETTVAQAKFVGHSEEEEFFRLLVHGFLHLLGYDHERGASDEMLMKEMEDLCLTLVLGP
ncbi:rRNA maturation RNase YbeY [Leptospira perolatii]